MPFSLFCVNLGLDCSLLLLLEHIFLLISPSLLLFDDLFLLLFPYFSLLFIVLLLGDSHLLLRSLLHGFFIFPVPALFGFINQLFGLVGHVHSNRLF